MKKYLYEVYIYDDRGRWCETRKVTVQAEGDQQADKLFGKLIKKENHKVRAKIILK